MARLRVIPRVDSESCFLFSLGKMVIRKSVTVFSLVTPIYIDGNDFTYLQYIAYNIFDFS